MPSGPGLHSITGHVRLTGYLVADDGRFAGTRVVGDAGGIPVELVFGTRIVGRTRTVDGIYRFGGIGPGAYVARTRVIGDVGDTTELLTVTNTDVSAADTLRLVSRGDLYPVPNPIVGSTSIYFQLPDTHGVRVAILDVAGDTVRTLRPGAPDSSGLYRVDWDTLDQDGHPAGDSMYWATLRAGADVRAQLLFH